VPESLGDDTLGQELSPSITTSQRHCAAHITDLEIATRSILPMPRAMISNLVHCVFSTKNRRDIIPDPGIAGTIFWRYRARETNSPHLGGGTQNHVHLLIALLATIALAKVIQDLKGNSSRWIGLHQPGFAWQQGYSAFSVSPHHKKSVMAYIGGQERHHSKKSFEEELTSMLKKAGVEYDERYILG